jgi:hypothetical protein
MKKSRMHELAKSRVAQIRMMEVCNFTVIGGLTVWLLWMASSMLIRFVR